MGVTLVVKYEGHRFTAKEMTIAGEKHKQDAALFRRFGPAALDYISLKREETDRIFAMLGCYYNYPALRTHIPDAAPCAEPVSIPV
jgi:hypothetical protein